MALCLSVGGGSLLVLLRRSEGCRAGEFDRRLLISLAGFLLGRLRRSESCRVGEFAVLRLFAWLGTKGFLLVCRWRIFLLGHLSRRLWRSKSCRGLAVQEIQELLGARVWHPHRNMIEANINTGRSNV